MLHLQEEPVFVEALVNELATSGVRKDTRPSIDRIHALKL